MLGNVPLAKTSLRVHYQRACMGEKIFCGHFHNLQHAVTVIQSRHQCYSNPLWCATQLDSRQPTAGMQKSTNFLVLFKNQGQLWSTSCSYLCLTTPLSFVSGASGTMTLSQLYLRPLLTTSCVCQDS